jgi:hypothetical protein
LDEDGLAPPHAAATTTTVAIAAAFSRLNFI